MIGRILFCKCYTIDTLMRLCATFMLHTVSNDLDHQMLRAFFYCCGWEYIWKTMRQFLNSRSSCSLNNEYESPFQFRILAPAEMVNLAHNPNYTSYRVQDPCSFGLRTLAYQMIVCLCFISIAFQPLANYHFLELRSPSCASVKHR